MFAKRQGEEKQQEFWIERTRVSKPPSQGFCSKLNEHLEAMDFARQVWALCEPVYREESRGGRPGIDLVVYFKMLMVGVFENLRSERAIAARCQDSLSVRAFLGYGLEESTPDHSSLSVIRQRLGPEIYQGVFEVALTALKAHGLFKGRHLGIDSSVIEANVSLRTLVHRNTEQAPARCLEAFFYRLRLDDYHSHAIGACGISNYGFCRPSWFLPGRIV